MNTLPTELVSYLDTLITPTHVGGETLTVLDLDAVEWDKIADGHYCGLIGVGTPTEAQVEHIWRVVKPGAHVLLVAPEDSPTGHKGACALEDRGFEIRDAILLVDEPGKLHYVPKAGGAERNAGTVHLAAKRKGSPIYEIAQDYLENEEALEELDAALRAAGIAEAIVDAVQENGLPKDQIPKSVSKMFRKREGADKYGNNHPTVKPKDVMAKLLYDVPKGSVVLDPFMGSGSTGIACIETGHSFIGIEREAEYIEISDARVRHWNQVKGGQRDNCAEIISEAPTAESNIKKDIPVHGGLFDLDDDE